VFFGLNKNCIFVSATCDKGPKYAELPVPEETGAPEKPAVAKESEREGESLGASGASDDLPEGSLSRVQSYRKATIGELV
jgi:hypothetical protein